MGNTYADILTCLSADLSIFLPVDMSSSLPVDLFYIHMSTCISVPVYPSDAVDLSTRANLSLFVYLSETPWNGVET